MKNLRIKITIRQTNELKPIALPIFISEDYVNHSQMEKQIYKQLRKVVSEMEQDDDDSN